MAAYNVDVEELHIPDADYAGQACVRIACPRVKALVAELKSLG